MFGFLNIRKPPGPTSHDIVAAVRRMLPRGVKVGHAGTLDPFAEGVLVVCTGPATRLAEYVQKQTKRYRATVTLGATSSTDDPTGDIEPHAAPVPPERAAVEQTLATFVGSIEQIPPAHSAIHVAGQRAYKLARRGEAVHLRPRIVNIHAVELLSYDWPELTIDVHCGSGTYIRSLARDIGLALDVGGYCSALQRTAVGEFSVDAAATPDELRPAEHLIDPVVPLGMPVVTLGEQAAAIILHGRALDVARLDMPEEGQRAEGQGPEDKLNHRPKENSSQPAPVSSTPLPPGEGASLLKTRADEGLFAAVDAAGRLLAVATLAEDGQAFKPLKVFPV